MTSRSHSFIVIVFAISAAFTTGCAKVRLQSPERFAHEVSKSAHGSAQRKCDRENMDASAYLECTRRNDAVYDAWRKEREQLKNNKDRQQ